MFLCFGEPPVRFLWCCCFSFHFWSSFWLLFFILLLFFICRCSSFTFLFGIIPHLFLDYRRVFTSISYFQPRPSQSDSRLFHFLTIPLCSYREGYGFERAFFTHRRFLSYAPSTTFYQHLSRLPWEPAVLLKVCRASYWSSKNRPGQSVCLINSNPQPSNLERFSFKFYHMLTWIACGEFI